MLRRAKKSDIEKIKPYIRNFNLDSDGLDYRKIYVFEQDGLIKGFGRYKNYDGFCELATVGVLEEFRGCGIGKKIVKKLLESMPSGEIWLTTVIPDYFRKFGFEMFEMFEMNENIPEQIILKAREICCKYQKPLGPSVFMRLRK